MGDPGSQELQSAVELWRDAVHALSVRCGVGSEGWEAIVCRRCPYDLGPWSWSGRQTFKYSNLSAARRAKWPTSTSNGVNLRKCV
jgi:hypothetical protein